MSADQYAESVAPLYDPDEYPEGHSPFCHKGCDHPCHDAYDQWVAARTDGTTDV